MYVIWYKFQETYQKNLSYEHLTVFAGLNQVSAGLNRFKPRVWQKQVFAGRNPTQVEDHPSKVQKFVNIHFMLINRSPDCSTCLFSWYELLIMVGGDFSQFPNLLIAMIAASGNPSQTNQNVKTVLLIVIS